MTRAGAVDEAPPWTRCASCGTLRFLPRVKRRLWVCPECGHHEPLAARERLAALLDASSAVPLGAVPRAVDPLGFTDQRPYVERLEAARARTGLDDAVVCARGTVDGQPVVVAAMDFRFLGGSLGSAAGEMITRAAEAALESSTPLVLVTASGGARMQEGVHSLMQMAKTSQALAGLDEAGILTISLVTDPTFGGVAASFATLADVIVAEPRARLGFAGPRVIQQTIGHELPPGFQRAEFLLEQGLIDAVEHRDGHRSMLARLLRVARPVTAVGDPVDGGALVCSAGELPERDAWESVQLARNGDRPTTTDYALHMLDWFQELRGDRMQGDCPAIVGGLGCLAGMPVMLIGHQKGHSTQERLARRFGMGSPEGYRKSARLVRLAAKLGIPVVTLVDTPGAYPGVEAEERGQALAIAENLRLLSTAPVPIVAVVTGEGGSGGALALGIGDRVLACGNAIYSVISPEGCAAILWRDSGLASHAAAALRLDARSLLADGIIDGVVPEPPGGAQADPVGAAHRLRSAVVTCLHELLGRSGEELVRERRLRFRRYGMDACRDAPA